MNFEVSDDSDDEILTSVDQFGALFSNVHRQVRKETIQKVTTPQPSSKSKKTKTSKVDGGSAKKAKKDKAKTNAVVDTNVTKKKVKTGDAVSNDIEELMAEADKWKSTVDNLPRYRGKSNNESAGSSLRSPRARRSATTSRSQLRANHDVVTLSDDDDNPCNINSSMNMSFGLNSSILRNEVDVPVVEDVSLRFLWKNEVLRLQFPKSTKMSKVRMDVAAKVKVRADDLVILDGNEEILDNVLVADIPFGKTLEVFERVLSKSTKSTKGAATKTDADCIQVKLQGSGGYRQRITLTIKRTTHIKQLVNDFVKKFGCEGKNFQLTFDGDVLSLEETPESLELEGGEMLDIVEIS